MAKSMNQVLLLGNLTKQPELQHVGESSHLVRFSLALNRPYKDKNGEWQEAVDYVDCVAWDNLAQQIVDALDKGAKVLVDGRLQTRSWIDEAGTKQYRTEVLAKDVTFVTTAKKIEVQ